MTTPRLPRDDLAAALAARRELGPDYDDAFVEALAERIEAALADRPPSGTAGAPRTGTGTASAPGRGRGSGTGSDMILPAMSLFAGIPLTAICAEKAGLPGLLVVWVAIVLVNLVHSRRPR